MKLKLLLSWAFVWMCFVHMTQAQTSVNSGGGEATGTGGSVSYSVGQIFTATSTSAIGTITEGIQQPSELIVTGIDDVVSFLKLYNVYPNPVNHTLFLQKKERNSVPANYRLVDLNGKIILSGIITEELLSIDVQNLESSVYFLQLVEKDSTPKSFKIIKH